MWPRLEQYLQEDIRWRGAVNHPNIDLSIIRATVTLITRMGRIESSYYS